MTRVKFDQGELAKKMKELIGKEIKPDTDYKDPDEADEFGFPLEKTELYKNYYKHNPVGEVFGNILIHNTFIRCSNKISKLLDKCDSPIEILFAMALMIRGEQNYCGELQKWVLSDYDHEKYLYKNYGEGYLPTLNVICPKKKIGAYIPDFYIYQKNANDEESSAIVECDGHDFHEKTKEQVARDKKRDRYFQSLNMKVIRFSGSEIYKDPFACVDELNKILDPWCCGGKKYE